MNAAGSGCFFARGSRYDCLTAAMFPLHADAGRLVASNSTDSVLVYSYSPETGFQLLQADRYSRPVNSSCIVQHPRPSQATAVATDKQGTMLFLAPEPDSYSCERNMYTAAQYNMGQRAAGVVPANLLQPAKQVEPSLASVQPQHQDQLPWPNPRVAPPGLDLSSSDPASSSTVPAEGPAAQSPAAQLHRGAEILTSMHDDRSHHLRQQASHHVTGQSSHTLTGMIPTGSSPTSTPSALTAALSGPQHSQRHQRHAMQQQLGPDCSSWVSVTTAGDVIQLSSITPEQHQVLAALQEIMAADAVTAPLSGCDLSRYRTGEQQAGPRQHLQGGSACLWEGAADAFVRLIAAVPGT